MQFGVNVHAVAVRVRFSGVQLIGIEAPVAKDRCMHVGAANDGLDSKRPRVVRDDEFSIRRRRHTDIKEAMHTLVMEGHGRSRTGEMAHLTLRKACTHSSSMFGGKAHA